jgi:FixJ family two-component response regulator
MDIKMAGNEFDVIVIDDEVTVTQIFQQYFLWKYKDWRYQTFNNPETLLDSIARFNLTAKVWIIDIMMPGKNGAEIAAFIRQQYGQAPVVLAYTALDRQLLESEEKYKNGMKHFNHIISKKEDFASILSLVEVWVGDSA